VIALDEDLPGERVAAARHHAQVADVVVAAHEGRDPQVGAEHAR